MRRLGLLSVLMLVALLSLAIPAASAQYAIPDCFVARVNSTFPQEEYWASRDEWYRQLGVEWNAQVGVLTPQQRTAYTDVFCSTLVVVDGGDSEDGLSRIVEWSYQPVESWLSQTGGRVTPANTTTDTSAPANTDTSTGGAVTPLGNDASSSAASAEAEETDIFSTEFDTIPNELILQDADFNEIPGQLTPGDGDSALRIKAADFSTLYYDDNSLTDYALEVRARINSGELLMTVRGGDDFCSGYDFGVYPADDYAYLRVTDENCDTTILADVTGITFLTGEMATLRLEASGNQLTALVDGQVLLSAQDDSYTSGYPTIYFFSEIEPARDALIDVAALRIVPAGAPVEGGLTQHTAAHGQAVAELQALGLVPEGRATFIFQEPAAYFEGDGSWYTPLAQSAPHTNIVIAGSLDVTFNSPGEYESCSIMTRVVSQNGSAAQELSVGVDSDGDVIMVDNDDPDASTFSTFEYRPLAGGLDVSHHFLLVAVGNRASLYVDGQLYFDRIKVDERAGTYGVGLTSHDGDSRCEANNLWLYSFD